MLTMLLQQKSGAPEGTRTPGLLLRRQLLYPTELLARICQVGAGDGNRTRIPSLEGWCPGHCATPACALHSNRQLVHITIGHRPCQEKNRRTGHFSVETALSTLRRQSQRVGDGQKSAVCYTGNNKKKGGRDHGYGKDRHLSGITPQGAGHDTAAGGGYIRGVQQNCQQMGVRSFP